MSAVRKICVFLIDLLCMTVALFASFAAAGMGEVDQNKLVVFGFLVLGSISIFLLLDCYGNDIWEFDTISAVKICVAVACVHAVLGVLSIADLVRIPAKVVLNALAYSLLLCGGYRLFLSAWNKMNLLTNRGITGQRKRVLIVGAGDAGGFLVNLLNYDASKGRKAVAFIDDNDELWGKKVKGIPVVGGRKLIPYAAEKYKIDEIIVAIPYVDNSTIRDIFRYCCEAGCPVKRFGNLSSVTARGLEKATINEINVEDLLGRNSVKLDLDKVQEMLEGRTVLVTGGAGSIGSEICRQVLNFGIRKLIILDINENGLFHIQNELNLENKGRFETVLGSIRDVGRLEEVFDTYRPEVVFHAAAHKHVPMMEYNPKEAVKNNIFGSYNVMKLAVDHRVRNFILISTDKAVNPTNIMGASKRVTELESQYMSKHGETVFATVRFGNVLGSNGSVIPLFKKQIQQGGPITVTDRNIERYFMTIPEAVQLVLEAASIAKGGELFVLDMGTPVKIYDLAENMIRLSGLTPHKDIEIQVTGLRPGEKMSEELRLHTEEVTKTSNDRIFVIQLNGVEDELLIQQLERMKKSLDEHDRLDQIFAEIKALVPTFEDERMNRMDR